jgi:hypothetical protein
VVGPPANKEAEVPIVYIHGVAVRDEDEALARATRRFREVPWPTIDGLLREHLAPVISDDPGGVPIQRIYWGDLGAQFSWGGRSLVSRGDDHAALGIDGDAWTESSAHRAVPTDPEEAVEYAERLTRAEMLRRRGIRGVRSTVTALRKPFEDFLPTFIGDVIVYVAGRGTADAPGPIPLRVLDGLDTAAFAAESRGEPLVVVTHSMGGQILYDALTHFIPNMPAYRHIRVDYWCSTASQVGFFEELGLFLASTAEHGIATGVRTPLPSAEHLGGWWNVWDHSDLLSFRADGIFEGVDDTAFFAAGTLATDHNRYVGNPDFHRMLAARVRAALGRRGERAREQSP